MKRPFSKLVPSKYKLFCVQFQFNQNIVSHQHKQIFKDQPTKANQPTNQYHIHIGQLRYTATQLCHTCYQRNYVAKTNIFCYRSHLHSTVFVTTSPPLPHPQVVSLNDHQQVFCHNIRKSTIFFPCKMCVQFVSCTLRICKYREKNYC